MLRAANLRHIGGNRTVGLRTFVEDDSRSLIALVDVGVRHRAGRVGISHSERMREPLKYQVITGL